MSKNGLDVVEEDTLKDRFLIFDIDGEFYGIEIMYVTEIISMQSITEIPELPEHMRGIINLRGKIIPVMDVRLRFKKAFREYNERTCIIVIDINELSMGLIVDSVSEVMTIFAEEIVLPPEFNKSTNKYIKGIGKVEDGVKLLIDCHQLFNEKDTEIILNSV